MWEYGTESPTEFVQSLSSSRCLLQSLCSGLSSSWCLPQTCTEVSAALKVDYSNSESCSILNAPPLPQVLWGARENALAEFETTLQKSRGGWEHLGVLRSSGEGYQSVWEISIWLPDRITFCWCQCPKWFQVCYPRHFRRDDSWLNRFSGYSISEFVLWGGPFLTKVAAKEIFLTNWMQLHKDVERVTRILWQSLRCPKCIPWQLSPCLQREIPCASHVGLGCSTTSPKGHEPSPFRAGFFLLHVSSFLSDFLCLWNAIRGHHLLISQCCLEQTALQRVFRQWSHLLFLSNSSRYHLGQGKNWPPHRQHVVW